MQYNYKEYTLDNRYSYPSGSASWSFIHEYSSYFASVGDNYYTKLATPSLNSSLNLNTRMRSKSTHIVRANITCHQAMGTPLLQDGTPLPITLPLISHFISMLSTGNCELSAGHYEELGVQLLSPARIQHMSLITTIPTLPSTEVYKYVTRDFQYSSSYVSASSKVGSGIIGYMSGNLSKFFIQLVLLKNYVSNGLFVHQDGVGKYFYTNTSSIIIRIVSLTLVKTTGHMLLSSTRILPMRILQATTRPWSIYSPLHR